MRLMGRHQALGGTDAEVGVSRAFAARAFGSGATRGRHLELNKANAGHPGWRQRQARKLWALLKRNALHPNAVADVRARYAREFAAFARAEAKAQATT